MSATLVALVATVGLTAIASQTPNAYSVGQDFGPMPPSPITWAQSREAAAAATAMAAVVGLLMALALSLGRFATTGQLPRRRFAIAVAATPPIAILAFLVLLLLAIRGDARLPPDCETFRFDRAAFRSPEPNQWQPQAIGLDGCGLLAGWAASEVRQILGDPDPRKPGQLRNNWEYHGGYLQLGLYRGRARDLSFWVG